MAFKIEEKGIHSKYIFFRRIPYIQSFIKFVSLAQKQYTLKEIQEITAANYFQFTLLCKRLCAITPIFLKKIMVDIDTKHLSHLFISTRG